MPDRQAVGTSPWVARVSFAYPWSWHNDGATILAMYRPDGSVRKTRQSFDIIGHAHELTFSCYRRLPLLARDRTRRWFLEGLDQARTRHEFEVWSYVIMLDHVHILLLPLRRDYRIATILKAIKQPVGRRAVNYLRRHAADWLQRLEVTRSDGHREYRFWQPGGGYDRNIDQPKTAWACVDYIHHNPVRRGLVDTPTDWPWSSAGQYAGVSDVTFPVNGCPPDP